MWLSFIHVINNYCMSTAWWAWIEVLVLLVSW